AGLGRGPSMIKFPVPVMRKALKLLGKEKMAEGLFDDLILNTAAVTTAFDWKPKYSTLEGMKEASSIEAKSV
ncbi:MAG: hypothetical protein AAF357_17475, partial [Verrucomicrobiota bacterium]